MCNVIGGWPLERIKWKVGLSRITQFFYLRLLFSVPNATRYFGSWMCYHLQVKARKETTDLIKKERAIPISKPCVIVSVPDIRSLWILYPALKEAVEQRTHRHVDYGMCSWRNRILGTYLTYVVYSECETWYFTSRAEHKLRVSEEKLLKNVFGPMWEEVTGEWRKLRNEELRGLHFSINNPRMIKQKRIRWVGYVARVRGKRNIYRVLVGKTWREKNQLEDLGVDGNIILKWVFR